MTSVLLMNAQIRMENVESIYVEVSAEKLSPLGIYYHAGYCCGSQMQQLGRTIDYFPPLIAWIAPPKYYESHSLEWRLSGKIQVDSSEFCVQSVRCLQQ